MCFKAIRVIGAKQIIFEGVRPVRVCLSELRLIIPWNTTMHGALFRIYKTLELLNFHEISHLALVESTLISLKVMEVTVLGNYNAY